MHEGDVVGHVIVKVGLRGMTQLAAQMRQRNLSAAAHFSRYFYDPAAPLSNSFDAQKVTVEGDALVLLLLEACRPGAERLAVARACCLARRSWANRCDECRNQRPGYR